MDSPIAITIAPLGVIATCKLLETAIVRVRISVPLLFAWMFATVVQQRVLVLHIEGIFVQSCQIERGQLVSSKPMSGSGKATYIDL